MVEEAVYFLNKNNPGWAGSCRSRRPKSRGSPGRCCSAASPKQVQGSVGTAGASTTTHGMIPDSSPLWYLIPQVYLKLCWPTTGVYEYLYVYRHMLTTYVYTYMCVCVRIHVYMYTRIRTYIHTYIHAYIHSCIHAYIHTYIHTYIHRYIRG